MKVTSTTKIFAFALRFAIIHLLAYILISIPFQLTLQIMQDIQLDSVGFYKPFESLSLVVAAGEIIRGLIIGLMLFPLRNAFLDSPRGFIFLFGVLWGLVLIGNVEPMPGSIEGITYTVTTIHEHILVAVAGAVHSIVVCLVFLRWEKGRKMTHTSDFAGLPDKKRAFGFSLRFLLLHVITYFVAGVFFYNLQDYSTALDEMELFQMFRPLDDPLVAMTMIIQIPRGLLLSLFILPFYRYIVVSGHGWLLLFGIMIVFTGLASYSLPWQLVFLAQRGEIIHLQVGLIEITVQMGLFAILLFLWEKRIIRKAEIKGK